MEVEPSSPTERFLGIETFRLWEGRAPGATSESADETPSLTVFRPQPGYEVGTAVIIAPGGGYIGLAANLEGRQAADWFASRGITAFVLKYRVGPSARLPIPIHDGQRAIQFVRANAERFGVLPSRIGMLGFSAGGHIAAMVGAQAVKSDIVTSERIAKIDGRPDFLILAYPWLEATKIDSSGQSQYCMFAGGNCDARDFEKYQPLRFITKDMPPTFIYHTSADSLVSPAGSLRFYQALQTNKIPSEIHVYAGGEHGSGMGGPDPALSRWPDALEGWLRGQHLLARITGS